MIDYVDPVPPLLDFFSKRLTVNIVGNTFAMNQPYPQLLVRSAGGNDYSRIQLISRSESSETESMDLLIQAINLLERYAADISGLSILWCSREGNPFPSLDDDTGKPEAWCYMRLEYLEG